MKRLLLVLFISLFIFMVDWSQTVANIGNWLGAPELKWSENLAGTTQQTRPTTSVNPISSAAGLTGGYVNSPVPGGSSVVPVNSSGTKVNPLPGNLNLPYPTQGITTTSSGDTSGGGGGGGGDEKNPDLVYVDVPGRGQVKLSDLQREEERTRNDINAGYDAYFQQLDSILNSDLPAQQSAQLGIAESQGRQAENTLGSQRTQGLADLATQTRQTEQGQAKSLQDLANDIRNQFRAGQVYLGSRGAGDSSAANQYAYAIAKMGNQARGNVMQQTAEIKNQIADREFKLNQTYNTELNNIKESVNQKTLEIANWFSQAQSQLKQAKAQGLLSKGQDLANLSKQLLQNATQQLLFTQQQAAARQSALDQWAMNNSTTINELKSNLAQVSAYQAPGVVNPGVNGQLSADTSGNLAYNQTPGTGYGVTGINDKDWLARLYGSTANTRNTGSLA